MSAAEQERIAGATSCLAIVRHLEQAVVPDSSDRTLGAWYAKRDAAIAAFLETAGELSPRAAGVMSVLAELVVSEKQDGSTYFIDQWVPESTMTADEVAAIRAEVIAKGEERIAA